MAWKAIFVRSSSHTIEQNRLLMREGFSAVEDHSKVKQGGRKTGYEAYKYASSSAMWSLECCPEMRCSHWRGRRDPLFCMIRAWARIIQISGYLAQAAKNEIPTAKVNNSPMTVAGRRCGRYLEERLFIRLAVSRLSRTGISWSQ